MKNILKNFKQKKFKKNAKFKKKKKGKKKDSGAVAWYEALDVSVFPAL